MTAEGRPPAAGTGSDRLVQIVHESLLTKWPRLERWRTQDAEGAQLRDELRQAAQLWDQHGRSKDLLWSGATYREFQVWRDRYPGGLSELEESFAAAMTALARRRLLRRRLAGLLAMLVAATASIVFGVLWRRGALETRRAEAAELLAVGRQLLSDDPSAALAFAIASLEHSDNDAARYFAVEAILNGPPAFLLSANEFVASEQAGWSPDGQRLALSRGALHLVELASGEMRRLSSGREVFARDVREVSLGFTTDGRYLVTTPVTTRGPIQPEITEIDVWEAEEGRLTRKLRHEPASFAFLRDDHVLTISRERGVALVVRRLSLDGTSQEVLGTLDSAAGPLHLDVDPTGKWLYWLREGQLLRFRLDDLAATARPLGIHEGEVALSAWPLHDRVVTADRGGEIRVWDPSTARLERTLRSPADARVLGLDPGGRYLASGPTDDETPGSMFLFDLAAPSTAEPIPLRGSNWIGVRSMQFQPGGSWLSTSHPHGARLWNLDTPRSIVLGRIGPSRPAIVIAPDGRLISTSDEGVVRSWALSADATEGVTELWSARGSNLGSYTGKIDLDSSGRIAVVADELAGRLVVVPLDGSPASVLELERRPDTDLRIRFLALDPSGERVAVNVYSTDDPAAASVRVVELSTGAERRLPSTGEESSGYWADPAWLPDGRLIIEGDAGLRVWNLRDGTHLKIGSVRGDSTGRMLVGSDSRTLVAAHQIYPSMISTLRVFDLDSGSVREITSHGERVLSIGLDPTGTVLVTGGQDGVVRVGPLTGEEPHLLYGHASQVGTVAVSPDGRWIASGGLDGELRLWPMPDLSKPALQELPYEELLRRLRRLTNLRPVRDPAASAGWRVEPGPFLGLPDRRPR